MESAAASLVAAILLLQHVYSLNFSVYSCFMFYALNNQLCQKLCQHNRPIPIVVCLIECMEMVVLYKTCNNYGNKRCILACWHTANCYHYTLQCFSQCYALTITRRSSLYDSKLCWGIGDINYINTIFSTEVFSYVASLILRMSWYSFTQDVLVFISHTLQMLLPDLMHILVKAQDLY